jgi:ABC-type glycerol-3-phosphate transport system substrate-binding protein
MDVRVLYVNNDALGEASVDPASLDTGNWDQLSELGAQLTARDGDVVNRWGFDHKIQAGHLWLWGFANDAEFMSEDAQTVTFNNPKVVEALDWGVQAYEAQGGFQSYEGFASTWQGDEQFARGQVAMTEYENWMLNITAGVAPDLNFTVMPILHRGGGDPISYTGGPAWAIPEESPDPEAAWIFIQFMNSVDTWRIAAEKTKQYRQENNQVYVPSLTANRVADQMQLDEYYEPIAPPFDDAVHLFPQVLETSRNLPTSASPVSKQLNDLMQSASQKALRGEQSAQEAMDEATDQAQKEIDEFR